MLLQSFYAPSRRFVGSYGEDPFRIIERALCQCGTSPATEASPLSIRLDVKEDEKAYHITADLPGLTENEIDLTFDDGLLTLKGEKKLERSEKSEDDKATWHITERSQGSFERKLSLPVNVETDKIEARFDKGVLSVTLPKSAPEQAPSKKINIKAG